MYDTIIIGAGMSALAAGIRLAHFDQRVCILERHTTIGGMNSFYRLRGRNYDVGLHAVTNYAPKGARRGPLPRLLRQLRFQWDEFALAPQLQSAVVFPNTRLSFSNDPALLEAEVARAFPAQKDNFQNLRRRLIDYQDLEQPEGKRSTRTVLNETLSDPLLREMILCPVMWYGNACEHDMPFGQFSIMFRSLFLEGMARPLHGVRVILKKLVRRYRELGGELKLRSGVSRIVTHQGRATGVVLDNGVQLEGRHIVSCAGLVETMRLCGLADESDPFPIGRLTFAESISILDKTPQTLGHDQTIVFFNDSDQFHWRAPQDRLCDLRTGVVCTPNNFDYDPRQGSLREGVMRITALADYGRWCALDPHDYRLEKLRWYDRMAQSAVRFVPDFRARVIDSDMFTPRTIRRYTWRLNGAVYGSPHKQMDGTTPLQNLFVCGTDQGFVGIIGAIVSGIGVANRHLLRGGPTPDCCS